MLKLDIDKIVNDILDSCYKSDDDIHCVPFDEIVDDLEQESLIINEIKNKLDLNKEVYVVEVLNNCFYLRVHKFDD